MLFKETTHLFEALSGKQLLSYFVVSLVLPMLTGGSHVGTLKTAKKWGIVSFGPDVLFERTHDNEIIHLNKEEVEPLASPAPSPRRVPSPAASPRSAGFQATNGAPLHVQVLILISFCDAHNSSSLYYRECGGTVPELLQASVQDGEAGCRKAHLPQGLLCMCRLQEEAGPEAILLCRRPRVLQAVLRRGGEQAALRAAQRAAFGERLTGTNLIHLFSTVLKNREL